MPPRWFCNSVKRPRCERKFSSRDKMSASCASFCPSNSAVCAFTCSRSCASRSICPRESWISDSACSLRATTAEISPRRCSTTCVSSRMRCASACCCWRNEASNCSSAASATLLSVNAALAASRCCRNFSSCAVCAETFPCSACSRVSSSLNRAASAFRFSMPSRSCAARLWTSKTTVSIFWFNKREEFCSALNSPSRVAIATSCSRNSVCACCRLACNSVCSPAARRACGSPPPRDS